MTILNPNAKFNLVASGDTNLLFPPYCEDVAICLQTYFNYSEVKALELINTFWKDEPVFDEDDYRLHENSYYWAVVIHLKAEKKFTSQWWKDSPLWPPPQDYLERQT